MCPPAPSVLNVGQFLTDEEVEGAWEVAHRRKWEARREALEIKASPLVQAFWHKTDIDLMMVSIKCCWEPAPRTLHHQKENGPLIMSSPISMSWVFVSPPVRHGIK